MAVAVHTYPAGSETPADGMGVIRIVGSRQFFWPQPRYELLLDGALVGTMGLKEDRDIAVAPGRHTIRAMWNLRFYWRRSQSIELDLQAGGLELLQLKHDRLNGGVVLRRF